MKEYSINQIYNKLGKVLTTIKFTNNNKKILIVKWFNRSYNRLCGTYNLILKQLKDCFLIKKFNIKLT